MIINYTETDIDAVQAAACMAIGWYNKKIARDDEESGAYAKMKMELMTAIYKLCE